MIDFKERIAPYQNFVDTPIHLSSRPISGVACLWTREISRISSVNTTMGPNKMMCGEKSLLLDHYRKHLKSLSQKEFQVLDKRWISIYDKTIKKKREGVFTIPWTKALSDIAQEHGYTIQGVLPHYGSKSGDLKKFTLCPEIVPHDQTNLYKSAGHYVEGERVYIGKSTSSGDKKSIFLFE